MKPVMLEIIEWGKGLPYWEQIGLDKIIAGENITVEDEERFLNYLLEDEGLIDKCLDRETPRFYCIKTDIDAQASSIRLLSISNLINVNALAENQILTFGEGLTLIYGENGSGKSGYARVLASAAFTRGDRDVLPNITRPIGGANSLSADITILQDGITHVLHYIVNRRCENLASFYVFDSTSVRVHMNDQNPLSFSPAGLSFLKQLAEVTDRVRERLNARVQECSQGHDYINFFPGDSKVHQMICSLGPATDLDQLKILSTLSSEEKKRRSELYIKIGNIELDQVRKDITQYKARIAALEDTIRVLRVEREALCDTKLERINSSLHNYNESQEAANKIGVESFRPSMLKTVGSPEWRRMINSAREMAEDEGGEGYPGENDVCLLCQQPLSSQAHLLLHKLWDFLRGQAQESVRLAKKTLNLEMQGLQNIKVLSTDSDFSSICNSIGEGQIELQSKLKETIKNYEDRYEIVRKNINPGKPFEYTSLNRDCIEDLEKFITTLRIEKEQLENLNLEEEVNKLEIEKRELDHRLLLGQLLEKIEAYVEKRKWGQDAEKVGGSTHHITSIHNGLFKRLVTDEYVKIFEKYLTSMGRPLRVKISTTGKKGQTLKQIILEAAPDAKDLAKPEKVLSEGEKRAVALADFLTEIELDSTSSGIILDDPVTSLDLEWRETIAKLLVEKAKDRQVIIFTHDLPFLYYLKENAEKYEISTTNHWIRRGDEDGRPGYVFLDNSPALEKEYKKPNKAKDLHQKALKAGGEYQEFLLKEGFGSLRTSYEAFIIFDMFKSVVMRFNERISFGRLKDIRWDNLLANDVISSCERLSRYIEGHLHSDNFTGNKPTPATLKEEIDHFDTIQKRLKNMKTPK